MIGQFEQSIESNVCWIEQVGLIMLNGSVPSQWIDDEEINPIEWVNLNKCIDKSKQLNGMCEATQSIKDPVCEYFYESNISLKKKKRHANYISFLLYL